MSAPSPPDAGETQPAAGPDGLAAAPEEPPAPPELAPALAAYEAGDFRTTYALIAALLATEPPPALAKAARRLRKRMAPDPWALRFGVIALAMLVAASLIYIR